MQHDLIKKIFLFVVLLFTTSVFANSKTDPQTLLTVKLYFEPNDQFQKLSYTLTLPKDDYYSFYRGSDLPTWKVVDANVIKGELHPVELMNIRIHAKNSFKQHTAHLTVTDPKHSRIVWKGKFNYNSNATNKIKIITEIENKKYYETTLKLDKKERIVSFETAKLN